MNQEELLSKMSDEELAAVIKMHQNGYGTRLSAALSIREVCKRPYTTNKVLIEFGEWMCNRIIDGVNKSNK